MSKRRLLQIGIPLLVLAIALGTPPAVADTDADTLSGTWYGTFEVIGFDLGGRFFVEIFPIAPGAWAGLGTFPDLGFYEELVGVFVSGDEVAIGDPSPGGLLFEGVRDGDEIAGTTWVPAASLPFFVPVDWILYKDAGEEPVPGAPPVAPCDLPALHLTGTAAYSSAFPAFLPAEGAGYLNGPVNGETWTDQYRSYLRRDLQQVVRYATAKVACLSAGWDWGSGEPLWLIDMSEADGSIPGTSVGAPGHPPGTHTNGHDLDTAYYQLFAPDNKPRVIGVHWDATGTDQYHLTEPPYALDVWRTALFIACLSEHPRMRVIGVDGQAGPLVDEALDDLVMLGYVDAALRDTIPLMYEEADQGYGFFNFHHHHLHVSMNGVHDVVSSVEMRPKTLNPRSQGRSVTAWLEFEPGLTATQVGEAGVVLVLDGHTLLRPIPDSARVGDYDDDGIPDLKLKFDRQAILDAVGTGTVTMTVAGWVAGVFFQDVFTVQVQEK